jgi:hypothetical protein
LINTNGNIEGIFPSVNFQGNISVGKFPRDFTDRNIPSVYTEGITVRKKLKQIKKNDDVPFLPM